MLFGMFYSLGFWFSGIKGCPAPQRWCQEFDSSILGFIYKLFNLRSASVIDHLHR